MFIAVKISCVILLAKVKKLFTYNKLKIKKKNVHKNKKARNCTGNNSGKGKDESLEYED